MPLRKHIERAKVGDFRDGHNSAAYGKFRNPRYAMHITAERDGYIGRLFGDFRVHGALFCVVDERWAMFRETLEHWVRLRWLASI